LAKPLASSQGLVHLTRPAAAEAAAVGAPSNRRFVSTLDSDLGRLKPVEFLGERNSLILDILEFSLQ